MRSLKFLKYQFIPDKNQVLGSEPASKDSYYRPLAHVIPMFCYAVFGDNTFGYHVFNLILFCLAGFMIFCFISTVFQNPWLGALTGLFYLVHPINSVMVNYITASIFPTQVIFMLASLWFISSVIPAKTGIQNIASIFFFALALMCHETAMALPFYLLAFLLIVRRMSWRQALIQTSPFFIFLGIYFIYRLFHASLTASILDNYSQFHMNVFEYAASFVKVIFWYTTKLFYPFGIVLIWVTPVVRWYLLYWLLAFLGLGGTFIFLLCRYKNHPPILLGLWWLALGFLPAGLACLFQPTLGVLLEPHWFVFPVIGFFLVLASIISSRQFFILALLLIIPWLTLSRIYNSIWSNEKTYCYYWFNSTSSWTPEGDKIGNSATLFDLGQSYLVSKEYVQARYYYEMALARGYTPWLCYVNLGVIDLVEGKYKQAQEHLAQGSKNYPLSPTILSNMGIMYFKQGHFSQAKSYFLQSLSIDPLILETRLFLAKTLESLGEKDSAHEQYETMLQLSPHFEPAIIWMIKWYFDHHDKEHVLELCRELYKHSHDPLSLKNVGILFQMYGLQEEAARSFEKARE